MKIEKVTSEVGPYRLVDADVFDHLIATVEAYGEWNGNPLVGMLLGQAYKAEEVEVIEDDEVA